MVHRIAANLAQLTEELNKFKPASTQNAGGVQKEMSEQFEQRLTLQSNRMDSLSENIQNSKNCRR